MTAAITKKLMLNTPQEENLSSASTCLCNDKGNIQIPQNKIMMRSLLYNLNNPLASLSVSDSEKYRVERKPWSKISPTATMYATAVPKQNTSRDTSNALPAAGPTNRTETSSY
mmetsp:Transcript_18803/g.40319  ORF Transcript_18803/g.40319 Transcript_18803/m.40319 type:complete len:113 (+) Transcript_18803:454-792(+)